jgi:hypothetical protein
MPQRCQGSIRSPSNPPKECGTTRTTEKYTMYRDKQFYGVFNLCKACVNAYKRSRVAEYTFELADS